MTDDEARLEMDDDYTALRRQIISTLSETYRQQGISIWLNAPNRNLKGEIPRVLMEAGRGAEVLEAAQRIEGGAS